MTKLFRFKESTVCSPGCDLRVYLVCGFSLVICCFFSELHIFSFFSLLVFAGFFVYLLKNKSIFILKYGAFVFASFANIVGCALVELLPGVWLPELQTYSYFYGSLPLIIMAWGLFFFVAIFADSKMESYLNVVFPVARKNPIRLLPYLNFAVFALVLYLFVMALPNPSFGLGIDRFAYSDEFITGLWSAADTFIKFLIIIPLLAIRKDCSKVGVVSVALYLIYLLWIGSKFGEFFYVACLAVFVFYDEILKLDRAMLNKVVAGACGVLVFLLVLSGIAFSLTSSKPVGDFYFERMAQQGQLWWATYDKSKDQVHLEDFKNEISALSVTSSDNYYIGANHGIYKIMYLNAPSYIVDSKLSTGSRYTEAGFACAFYYGSYLGLFLFAGLMAFVVTIIQNGLIYALVWERLISALIWVRFYFFIRTSLSMFLFSPFFTPASILCIIYLVLSDLVFRQKMSILRKRQFGLWCSHSHSLNKNRQKQTRLNDDLL